MVAVSQVGSQRFVISQVAAESDSVVDWFKSVSEATVMMHDIGVATLAIRSIVHRLLGFDCRGAMLSSGSEVGQKFATAIDTQFSLPRGSNI